MSCHIDRFCCGCQSLESGCKVFGILNIIFSGFFILPIFPLYELHIGFLILFIFNILTSLILIYASHKRHPTLLQFWLVLQASEIVFLYISSVLIAIFVWVCHDCIPWFGPDQHGGDALGAGLLLVYTLFIVVITLITNSVGLYIWFCVNSLRRNLLSGEQIGEGEEASDKDKETKMMSTVP